MVRDLGDALREIKEPLGDLVSLEMGKIRAEGHGEVQEMIDICDFAVGLSRQLYGLTIASERPGHRMMEQWHPLGVVGVITAFNFPVAVWSWNAAHRGRVRRPGGLEARRADAAVRRRGAAHREPRHGRPRPDRRLHPASSGRGRDDRRADAARPRACRSISFTGSTSMGRHVAGRVAQRFGRTILELGGNNAIVVTEDADLDLAARAILFGAVGTAGQRCTTTRRIIVHASVVDDLTERLVQAYGQVRIGNPLDDATLMGPLVDAQAVDDMHAALEQAKDQGGRGPRPAAGARADLGAQFVEPTIVRMPAQTPDRAAGDLRARSST